MTTNTDSIIWAMSPRGKFAHAYCGTKSLESGQTLCGLECHPSRILEHFDLSNDIVKQVACPACIARLAFARFLKPLSVLYAERETAENTS